MAVEVAMVGADGMLPSESYLVIQHMVSEECW